MNDTFYIEGGWLLHAEVLSQCFKSGALIACLTWFISTLHTYSQVGSNSRILLKFFIVFLNLNF